MEAGGLRLALLALPGRRDRPGQEEAEDEQNQDPGERALARQHRGEREQPLGAAVELDLAFGNPLDIDRDLVRPGGRRHEAQDMAGDQYVAAGGELDMAAGRFAAVQLD